MSIVQEIKDLGRLDHIINVLFKYEFGHFIEKLRLKDRLSLHQRLQKDKFVEKPSDAYKLRKVFEELGGAFIKLAQLLSVRPDLVSKEYMDEFSKLQDNVPGFPFLEAKKIVESELKKPLKEVFDDFDEEPIASASIAQVHKAKLNNGKAVAVKIQRPNIKEMMERDIDLMVFFAKKLEQHNYNILNGTSPLTIINEFKKWTEKEMDFEQEAANTEIFHNNLSKDKNVAIPIVYRDYSTKKVLTLEYIDGIELHDIEKVKKSNINIRKVIVDGFNCILKQVFVYGFFHADPHPGNILILDKNRIAFVDFGIVGNLNDELKEQVSNLFIGIVNNDSGRIVETFLDMGLVKSDADIFRMELENIIKPIQGSELKDVIISEVLDDVICLAHKYKVKMPVGLVLFGKTMLTLEGIALKYNPNFKITVQSRHFLEKIIRQRKSPKEIINKIKEHSIKLKDFAVSFPEKTSMLLGGVKNVDMGLKYIDRDIRNLATEMDRSSNRVTFGLIITALIIASTIMMSYDQITILNISAFSVIGFSMAGLLIIFVLISMIREKKFKVR
ncbi:MAG: AarF/ABC1/UbiB kinase family protein [Nanoarchaeota archaeon]|nr:AarF/ABC1/UbiB kinase family protein [Nanoarchaeota archaeon]